MKRDFDYIYDVISGINYVSLSSAGLALVIFFIISFLKPNMANRVSLRLQAGVSLCDLFLHIILSFYFDSPLGPACTALGFFHVSLRQWYCFLNMAIGLNLQLIFIHEFNPKPHWEIWYWVIPISLSVLLNIPPLALGKFGRVPGEIPCFFISTSKTNPFVIINVALTLFIAFTYCTVVSMIVIFRIREDWSSITAATFNQVNPSVSRLKNLEHKMKRLVFRIALYPMVTIITLSGYAVYYIYFLSPIIAPEAIKFWSAFGQVSSGFLNLLAFCFDPSLHYCILEISRDAKRAYFSRFPNDDTQLQDISAPSNSIGFDAPLAVHHQSLSFNQSSFEPVHYKSPSTTSTNSNHSHPPSTSSQVCIPRTIEEDEEEEDLYHFTIFDDAQCRQAVNLF